MADFYTTVYGISRSNISDISDQRELIKKMKQYKFDAEEKDYIWEKAGGKSVVFVSWFIPEQASMISQVKSLFEDPVYKDWVPAEKFKKEKEAFSDLVKSLGAQKYSILYGYVTGTTPDQLRRKLESYKSHKVSYKLGKIGAKKSLLDVVWVEWPVSKDDSKIKWAVQEHIKTQAYLPNVPWMNLKTKRKGCSDWALKTGKEDGGGAWWEVADDEFKNFDPPKAPSKPKTPNPPDRVSRSACPVSSNSRPGSASPSTYGSGKQNQQVVSTPRRQVQGPRGVPPNSTSATRKTTLGGGKSRTPGSRSGGKNCIIQ